MNFGTLFSLTALAINGSAVAASVNADQINRVVEKLDLTTFPNSVGPRRMPGKRTFSDYGFVRVKKTATGAILVKDDKGWAMSFRIISTGPRFLRLCFYDKGLARPGDASVPSYNSTTALLVSKSRRGMWAAKQVAAGFVGCRNNPA